MDVLNFISVGRRIYCRAHQGKDDDVNDIARRVVSQLKPEEPCLVVYGEVHVEMDVQVVVQLSALTNTWHPVLKELNKGVWLHNKKGD